MNPDLNKETGKNETDYNCSESTLAKDLARKFLDDRATLEKYKYIVDYDLNGKCISNRYGKLIYANRFYLQMGGFESQEEVIGDGWQQIIADDNKERILKGWEKYLTMRLDKFWTIVRYRNIKTKEVFDKKVIMSIIQDNGYCISVMPIDFQVPDDFIEVHI